MLSWLDQRFPAISLKFLLMLSAASGIFVYQVSPLREPAFQPNSANAGSLGPGLQHISESHWVWGAFLLAALLASNLTFLLKQRYESINRSPRRSRLRVIRQYALWSVIGLILLTVIWLFFLAYLLQQWMID